ncbi:MAG: hypothetical protein AABY22_07465, partial [Nanoarchaeota archaeon]
RTRKKKLDKSFMPRTEGSGGLEQYPSASLVEGDLVSGEPINGRVGTFRKANPFDELKTFVETKETFPHDELMEKISTLSLDTDLNTKRGLFTLLALVEGDLRGRVGMVDDEGQVEGLGVSKEIYSSYVLEKINSVQKLLERELPPENLLDKFNVARFHELMSAEEGTAQEISEKSL